MPEARRRPIRRQPSISAYFREAGHPVPKTDMWSNARGRTPKAPVSGRFVYLVGLRLSRSGKLRLPSHFGPPRKPSTPRKTIGGLKALYLTAAAREDRAMSDAGAVAAALPGAAPPAFGLVRRSGF